MKQISHFVLMVTTLCVVSIALAQTDTGPDCHPPHATSVIPQEIDYAISKIFAFTQNGLEFIGTESGDRTSDQIELPLMYKMYREPLLSSDGTKLVVVYGDYRKLESILVIHLLTGEQQSFDLDFALLNTTPVSMVSLGENNIAISFYTSTVNEATILVVDTTTGNKTEIRMTERDFGTQLVASPLLSPDLTHIVYISHSPGDWGGIVADLTILDRETGKRTVLLSTRSISDITYYSWSPGGKYVAVAANSYYVGQAQNLILFNISGEVIAESRLSYPNDDSGAYKFTPNFAWSPLEERFLYRSGKTTLSNNVITLDTTNPINTCLPGDAIWSVDGNLLAIFQKSEATETTPPINTQAFVYDFATGTWYKLSGSRLNHVGQVIGWAKFE